MLYERSQKETISQLKALRITSLTICLKHKCFEKYKNNIELLILIDKDEPMKNQYVELINKYKEKYLNIIDYIIEILKH